MDRLSATTSTPNDVDRKVSLIYGKNAKASVEIQFIQYKAGLY